MSPKPKVEADGLPSLTSFWWTMAVLCSAVVIVAIR